MGQHSGPMLRQMYVWGRWFCDQTGLEYEWPVSDVAEAPAPHTPREHDWIAAPIGA